MNKETENTSKKIHQIADAPEQAQKPTLKQAVSVIAEILERMKKQISGDREDYLSFEVNKYSKGNVNISVYSGKANEFWHSPEFESLEEVEAFDFSENKIASFLKSKIKTPAQELKKEITEKERELTNLNTKITDQNAELAELKAKLARLEEKEAGNA